VESWILDLATSPLVYLGMYLFAAIDGVFPPIPSESLAIALAALSVSSGQPDLVLIFLVAATGALTGDLLAYAIGRRVDVLRIPFLRGQRVQQTLDWAGRTLSRRGASVILAARFIPVGRVAVNLSAGAVGYPWRRFLGLDALASVTWALYSAAIGIGAGAWFKGHPLGAIVIGLVGGLLIGLVIDWILRRLSYVRSRSAGTADPASTHRDPGARPGPWPR
jgi:membrane protein DedA with SNARE-associated domain